MARAQNTLLECLQCLKKLCFLFDNQINKLSLALLGVDSSALLSACIPTLEVIRHGVSFNNALMAVVFRRLSVRDITGM